MHHQPVMVESVLSGLVQDLHGTYLDATFGQGGHSCSLLKLLAQDAKLLVLDRDPSAICVANKLSKRDARVEVVHGRFGDLAQLLANSNFSGFDGILFDCGVSSPQLDDPSRGFSFQRHGPLDMRMDPTTGISAAEWLNAASEREIARVIHEYGEERNARTIAREIVKSRPLKCTNQLSQIVLDCSSHFDRSKHPATRTFQAIRMKINDELGELDSGLEQAFDHLKVNGRLATITFHSLEHRLVRRKFRNYARPDTPRGLPVQGDLSGPGKVVIRKAYPSYVEISRNPRARSAMLQVIERVAV